MRAVAFYLAVYLFMNLAAFAVIVARERETGLRDDISALYGLGADRPLLAWPMTIAMLSLAGFPATAGFFGKVFLIDAAADNGYTWLGVVIVLGSAISLAYYLRVVAAVWMRAPDERTLPAMMKTYGADRFFWASDYPHPDHTGDYLQALEEMVDEVPAPARAGLLGGNVRQAFGF